MERLRTRFAFAPVSRKGAVVTKPTLAAELPASKAGGVVGRLAPSPTGHLHLGHARSFLLAYWLARSQGGLVRLRLEDLDVARVSQAMIDQTLRDLEWLGLTWDGPARLQRDQEPEIREQALKLLAAGHAFACTCTRRDLRLLGAAEEAPGAPQEGNPAASRYPGLCRDRYASLSQAEGQAGRLAGVRLRVDPGPTSFVDRVFGHQSFDVAAEVGDFHLLRRDKTPAYQLAVTISDALDGVTEVARGADLLSSTARQILIQKALGLASVSYAHLPLVTDGASRRLSKRANDVSLASLRARGVRAQEVIAWVAHSAGQLPAADPRCPVETEDVTGCFDLALLPQEPVSAPESWLRGAGR